MAQANIGIGVLLTNLGTPDAPTPKALRRYLAEFLGDPRVIEKPRWLWWPILHGVILNVRPRRAAKAYTRVWTEHGSPLLYLSERLATGVQARLSQQLSVPVHCELAMRYGNPSIPHAMQKFADKGIERVVIIPLYPQYSATTTASTFDAVSQHMHKQRIIPEIRWVNQYYDDPGYAYAIAQSIRKHWQEHGQSERLMFSFHGLPKRYVDAGDPYRVQCEASAQLIAKELQLGDSQWKLCFQSRFGPEEWLQPYTDKTLEAWAKEGVKRVTLISPGFSVDCLETLEEIDMENKEIFLENGGENFQYVPCLNDSDAHVRLISDIAIRNLGGWI